MSASDLTSGRSSRSYSSISLFDEICFDSSDDLAAVCKTMQQIVVLKGLTEDMWLDEHEDDIFRYLIDTSLNLLVCYIEEEDLYLGFTIPQQPINEVFYFIKKANERITTHNFCSTVQFGTAKSPYIDSLYQVVCKIYAPMFLNESNWSDCIKSQLPPVLSKCLEKLFSARNTVMKRRIFYVPKDVLKYSIEDVIENRDLVREIEGVVMSWLNIMREALVAGTSQYSEDGPVEELEFWKKRHVEFLEIMEQLKGDEMQMCITILDASKSSFFNQFNLLYDTIKEGAGIAAENVKLLGILKEPCEQLENSGLENAPTNLKLILNLIRIIFRRPCYYNDNNKICGLLRKVSNLLIRICSKQINIDELLDNPASVDVSSFHKIIQCCNAWTETYAFSQKVHAIHSPINWEIDDIGVFAPIDAFILRCQNFLEICKYNERFHVSESFDFDPCHLLRGEKGVSVSFLLQNAEKSFLHILKELSDAKMHALDVQATTWNSHFAMFKRKVQNLEVFMAKSLSLAFEDIILVEEGLEILKVVYKFSEQEIVKRIFHSYAKQLYDLFVTDINTIKMEILKKDIVKSTFQPKYGGTAYSAALIPLRVQRAFRAIEDADFLPSTDYRVHVLSEYSVVLQAVDELSYSLFLHWSRNLPKEPQAHLSVPLLCRSRENPMALDLNLNREMIKLVEELTYWDKKRVEIPGSLTAVHKKCVEYLKLQQKVMFVVQEYNHIIIALSSFEQKMFQSVLSHLNDTYSRGLTKLTWLVPRGILGYIKECKHQCLVTQRLVTSYKNSNIKIVKLCEQISRQILFENDIRYPLQYEDFLFLQRNHQEAIKLDLLKLYNDILSEVTTIQQILGDDSEDFDAFEEYIRKVNSLLQTAVQELFQSSVEAICVLFGSTRKNKSKVVLEISLTLKDRQMTFCPSAVEIFDALKNVIKDIISVLSNLKNIEISLDGISSNSPVYSDIEAFNDSKNFLKIIQRGISELNVSLNSYLCIWKPYNNLWITSKSSVLQFYQAGQWTSENFENDIKRFLASGKDAQSVDRYKMIEFCLMDCAPLKQSAHECAQEWKSLLGSILNQISSRSLQNATNFLFVTSKNFKHVPQSLNELNNSIAFLKSAKLIAQRILPTFVPMYKNFCVLKKFDLILQSETYHVLYNLRKNWKILERSFAKEYKKLQRIQAEFQCQFLSFGIELENRALIVAEDFNENGPFLNNYLYKKAFRQIQSYTDCLRDFQAKERCMQQDSVFFDIVLKPLQPLIDLENVLIDIKLAWSYVKEYLDYVALWESEQLLQFEVPPKDHKIIELHKKCNVLKSKVQDEKWIVLTDAIGKLKELQGYFRVIENLQNSTLQPRHWEEIKKQLQLDFEPSSEEFTLKYLRGLDIEDILSKIESISTQATNEYTIEKTIKEVKSLWDDMDLSMKGHKSFYKLIETEELLAVIEDHQMTIGAVKASKYVQHFAEEVDELECSLSLMQEVVDLAQSFQRRYFYLENIFLGEAIRKQLPKESIEFDNVNYKWRDVTLVMNEILNVWEVSHQPDMVKTLVQLNRKLETVQLSLDSYLETKRQAFPRFYFISNDDLLSILGQIHNPFAIQPHLKKCFDNINMLEFGKSEEDGSPLAMGMHSEDGEYVLFQEPVYITGFVESWLCDAETIMRDTLSFLLLDCLGQLEALLEKDDPVLSIWIQEWPGQVCLMALQVVWTADITKSIKMVQESGVIAALKQSKKKWKLVLQKLSYENKETLNKGQREKCMCMILTLVNFRDIIDDLIQNSCNDMQAFEWIRQLRYYFVLEKDNCLVRQTTAVFSYAYEYLGNRHRLVITPLTDRCYLTMTTALYLNQGVCLKGPSGCGKTETVKDLGKALGCYVLVVNCSEGLDFKSLGRMLSGLAQIGAWCSFDEFNRINIEVLSVVAQQILSILAALKARKERFVFRGNEIRLRSSCGIFITINPAYYMGRSELPFNLVYMFRPLSMIVPDVQNVAEIILYANSFEESKLIGFNKMAVAKELEPTDVEDVESSCTIYNYHVVQLPFPIIDEKSTLNGKITLLSQKIKTVFSIASEQLSKQFHYDFGLRGVIKLLRCAIHLKRDYKDLSEEEIIFSAIHEVTLPKLHLLDLPIFKGIMADMFGDLRLVSEYRAELRKAIEESLQSSLLQVTTSTMTKILQFYETKLFHHAVILIGETGSGKSTTWKTLKEASSLLSAQGVEGFSMVQVFPFNPKSVTLPEVFGQLNVETGDWADGILSSLVRVACSDTKPIDKWILFDAPADTQWVESMNSLMDDNKILTLINGERIVLSPQVSLVFEVIDLSNCSPATVSRCGVVYHDYASIGWKPYFDTWLEKQPQNAFKTELLALCNKYLTPILKFKKQQTYEFLPTTELNAVMSFCKLLETFLPEATSSQSEFEDKSENLMLNEWFVFSIVWTVGGNATDSGRLKMDQFLRDIDPLLPQHGTIYDYYVHPENGWVAWQHLLPDSWKLPLTSSLDNVLVPTKDTLSYEFVTNALLNKDHPVLLVGDIGTGKSLIGKEILRNLDETTFSTLTVHMSVQSTSQSVQNLIETKLQKKSRGLFIPTTGQKLVTFLDDFNMPEVDKYGTQSPLELIRMWIDHGFWYDRVKMDIKNVQNMILLAAMGPPIGSRHCISTQLQNRFNVLNIISPQEPELLRIFSTLVKQKFLEMPSDVQDIGNIIAQTTLNTYKSVASIFLPTPAKIHYIFSLRDVAKVVQGLLLADKRSIDNRSRMLCFFYHESQRVFSDRLVDQFDRDKFQAIFDDEIQKSFNLGLNDICEESPIFAKFFNPEKIYQQVQNFELLKNRLLNLMDDFNQQSPSEKLELVLFKSAVEHGCRLARGIGNPGGSMLLIGDAGSGRHSLCDLIAFALGYQLFQIEMSKLYGIEQFREDLKKLLEIVSVKNKQVVFLVADIHLNNNFFMPYLNDILSSGEIPELFSSDELEVIYTELATSSERELSRNEVQEMFVSRIKSNLHIVFKLNASGSKFREHILNYPALINYLTIDWYEKWPVDALRNIAEKYMVDVNVGLPAEERRSAVCQVFSNIHEAVIDNAYKMSRELNRKVMVGSANYLDLVKNFNSILTTKSLEMQNDINRLQAGLKKIDETEVKVKIMAEELEVAKIEVVEFQKECDEYLVTISEQKVEADKNQEIVAAQSVDIEKEESRCKKLAEAAEKDLNEVLPYLEDAKKALESLNKKDIGEIKSYPKPPSLVETVMEAVMILRESEPTWAEAKRQLGSPFFLKELMEFEKDNITDQTLARIGKYVAKADFKPHIIGKVSNAAKSLCIWVRAMHSYGRIYRVVKPKRERLFAAQEDLRKQQEQLAEAQRKLKELNDKILRLKQEYENKLKRREELFEEERMLALKLERAANLVDGLRSEKKRWALKVSILKVSIEFVIGDSIIATSFVSYLGAFLSTYREKLVSIWRKKITNAGIKCSDTFDLAEFLSTEGIITDWNLKGLPTDHYSTENAIIMFESDKWPLLVDPEGQVVKWIKKMEEQNGLKVIDLQDPSYMKILQLALVYGTPVLIQNIQTEFDPALYPILKKHVISRGGGVNTIQFCEKAVRFDPNFKLYLATKLRNPNFTPDVISKTCIINFAIKEKGLEDQLLCIVVRKERPDLEQNKNALVDKIASGKKKLLELEETVLRLLNEAQGSLLDDVQLVEALQKSKYTSVEIEEQLSQSQEAETSIDAAREAYRPCASRGSVLFFALNDMSSVDPMYLFSLEPYVQLFILSIEKSPKDVDINRRINKLNDYHTYSVYKFACRAMFKKHKLLLSFHMCAKILEYAKELNMEEYDFFLRGGVVMDRVHQHPNPCPLWLPSECWDNITCMEQLPKFLDLASSFDENAKLWNDWYMNPEPEKMFLPGKWRNVCNEFQKMLFVRCLRPDRVTTCITTFIINNLGEKYLDPPVLDMESILKDSNCKTPLLFILSSGVDPVEYVASLANKSDMGNQYFVLSLGQGQSEAATALIKEAQIKGHWVYLANCHLLLSWLPVLEKITVQLQFEAVHRNFRLWLSSMPTSEFPVSVLQNSIKITMETPKGVKSNLRKLYSLVKQDGVYDLCENTDHYMKLLFSLSFYHSILIERQKFQYLGFNVVYNFNEADYKISEQILSIYLDKYDYTPWEAIKYLIVDINYGGHITDAKDMHLLNAYFEEYFCDEALNLEQCPLSPLPTYYIPKNGALSSYIDYIESLPQEEPPEVFGQNSNAEIAFRIQEASFLFENLLKLHPVKISTAKISMEDIVLEIIEDVLGNMPKPINKDVLLQWPEHNTPYFHLLLQEVRRYNNLIALIKQTLKGLEHGIKGIQVMSPVIEELFDTIYDSRVPASWLKTYPSVKILGSWVQDLKLRVLQINDWVESGETPVKFWLSGFTAPKSVLIAALQVFARESEVLLHELKWEFIVSALEEAHINTQPDEGIYVRGLFLEGAGWDNKQCVLMEPKPMHLITPMPVIHFHPVHEVNTRGFYHCPCYYIPKRTNEGTSTYVTSIDLKSKKPNNYWVKRGTALLMNLH